MPQLSPALGTLKMLGLPQTQAQVTAAAAAAPAPSGSGFSFHDFLSILNPLQHVPVVGTLYRAITGDKIGTPEKILGDTLYGGMLGAVASIADTAFQSLTGKDFGDTVLGLLTGHHDQPVAVAANAPTPNAAASTVSSTLPVAATPAGVTAQQATATPAPGFAALSASLIQKGVDPDLAQRALLAYQRSMTLPSAVSSTVLSVAQ